MHFSFFFILFQFVQFFFFQFCVFLIKRIMSGSMPRACVHCWVNHLIPGTLAGMSHRKYELFLSWLGNATTFTCNIPGKISSWQQRFLIDSIAICTFQYIQPKLTSQVLLSCFQVHVFRRVRRWNYPICLCSPTYSLCVVGFYFCMYKKLHAW